MRQVHRVETKKQVRSGWTAIEPRPRGDEVDEERFLAWQVIKSYVTRYACHADTVELAERRADRVSGKHASKLGRRVSTYPLRSQLDRLQLCVSVSLMFCTVLTFIAHWLIFRLLHERVSQTEGWIHHLARSRRSMFI